MRIAICCRWASASPTSSSAPAPARRVDACRAAAGGQALGRKVARYRPRCLAVLGVGAYRAIVSRSKDTPRPPTRALGRSHAWVLPNPSGLNAHYQPADLARLFAELRGGRPPKLQSQYTRNGLHWPARCRRRHARQAVDHRFPARKLIVYPQIRHDRPCLPRRTAQVLRRSWRPKPRYIKLIGYAAGPNRIFFHPATAGVRKLSTPYRLLAVMLQRTNSRLEEMSTTV